MTDLATREGVALAIAQAYPALVRALPSIAPSADDLPLVLALASYAMPSETDLAPMRALEDALLSVWHDLTPATAADYLTALRPVARALRRVPPFASFVQEQPGPIPLRRVGPYEAYGFLGRGGNGVALAARHVESGHIATLKLMAGTEGPVADWLGDDIPTAFLRIYQHGIMHEVYGPQPWAAREPAAETFRDLMVRRKGKPLPTPEILPIFRLACEGVAQLHANRVYRWSAHASNVLRVGQGWKLGDLGRCVMVTTANDPRFLRYFGLTESRPVERAAFLDGLDAGPWNAANGSGICARDPYRERRLKLDDCAMLGGLLVDLLAANRWIAFSQALETDPLCSGVYDLSGDRRRDKKLSTILNRSWRGDAGGAPIVAEESSKELSTYDDPRELWDDVAGVFGEETGAHHRFSLSGVSR